MLRVTELPSFTGSYMCARMLRVCSAAVRVRHVRRVRMLAACLLLAYGHLWYVSWV